MHQILAARMLYAVMDPSARQQYPAFLQQLGSIHPQLLQALQPADVEAFVRHCAEFSSTEPLIMVWVFDEAHTFNDRHKEGKALPRLLSAFVQFRLCCKADTLAMCLVASTIWSRLQLVHTSSATAKVVDLQLLPLSSAQCMYIVHTLFERMRKQEQKQEPAPQRQEQQEQQPLVQQQPPLLQQLVLPGHLPPTRSSLQQQLAGTTAAAAAASLQWPRFWLESSAQLQQHVQQWSSQLPGNVNSLVQLCGGNPRMLCLALGSMAHAAKPTAVFNTSKLSSPCPKYNSVCLWNMTRSPCQCTMLLETVTCEEFPVPAKLAYPGCPWQLDAG